MNSAFWHGKRVLLTGHTGFKGSWLALWLQSLGAQLTGYSLPPPSSPSLYDDASVGAGMRSIHGDVLDLDHLRNAMRELQPQVVFHMAAQSLVRRSYANPVDTFATNVLGTVNILESARANPALKAVVIVTSDKCYADREDRRPHKESDALGGHDPYSSSKGCAELVTAAYRDSFFSANGAALKVGVATARAGNVIGGGDWALDRLIPDAMRAASEGTDLRVRNPDSVRPWQHVLDPLCGYLELAENLCRDSERFSESWNFGPDAPKPGASTGAEGWTVSALLDRLCALWGSGMSWRAEPGQHPRESAHLKLDCTKARKHLCWEPRISLDSALRATVDWYKAHQSGHDMRRLTEEQIAAYQRTLVAEHPHP